MDLSKEELLYIWGSLALRRMYRVSPEPCAKPVWKAYMEDVFIKVEKELQERYPGIKPWHD